MEEIKKSPMRYCGIFSKHSTDTLIEELTACAEQVRQNQPDKIENLKRAAKAVLESFMGKAEAW